MKRDQMERLVREELERWDSDSNIDLPSNPAVSLPLMCTTIILLVVYSRIVYTPVLCISNAALHVS